MKAELFAACQRLLGATANGVYQGMMVAVLARLGLRLMGRTNAATRHALWFGTLVLVAALIPAHLFLAWLPRPEFRRVATPPAASIAGMTLAPSHGKNTPGLSYGQAAFPEPQPGESDSGSNDGAPSSPSPWRVDEGTPGDSFPRSGSDAVVTEAAPSRPKSGILENLALNFDAAIHLPPVICLGLVSAWVLITGVRGGLIAARLADVRRVKAGSRTPGQGLEALFDRLRNSLGVRRNVRLRVTGTHRSAVVLGFVHPVILLPTEMEDVTNGGEVEDVLRHELAHVDRWDDWGNLAQQLIQGALFFHPAVWWISARLTLEREIACDDQVLEARCRPRAYALTLANVASRMNQSRQLLAPGVSNNNSQLQQRITMILDTRRDRSPRLAKSRLGFFTTATALLAVLAIEAGPRLVLAQSLPTASAAPRSGAITPSPTPKAAAADAAPTALPPDLASSESGPRAKPDLADNDNDPRSAEPSEPTAPEPPEPPVAISTPSSAGIVALAPVAPVADFPSVPPTPSAPTEERPSKRHMSVEERLDRIERILENLQARGGTSGHLGGNRSAGYTVWGVPNAFAYSSADSTYRRAEDEAKRAAEQATRAAEAGQRAAEKAMRDGMQLRTRDFATLQDNYREMEAKGKSTELQGLRSARESLQREMEKLDRQIKRLEEERASQKTQGKGRSDDSDEGPEREKPATR